jgi:hypothetical protein
VSEVDVESAVPSGHMTLRFRRWLAIFVGLAALSAATLSFLASNSGRHEEQAFVDASRDALQVFVKLAASGPRYQFEVNAARQSTLLDARSTARASEAALDLVPLQVALGLSIADNEASQRLLDLSDALRRVPATVPGLDDPASESIRVRSEKDIEPIIDAQAAAAERADRHGTRQGRAMFGLGMVAITASLLGLAGLMGSGRAGRIVLVSAGGVLVLALSWGLSGLLV